MCENYHLFFFLLPVLLFCGCFYVFCCCCCFCRRIRSHFLLLLSEGLGFVSLALPSLLNRERERASFVDENSIHLPSHLDVHVWMTCWWWKSCEWPDNMSGPKNTLPLWSQCGVWWQGGQTGRLTGKQEPSDFESNCAWGVCSESCDVVWVGGNFLDKENCQ